MANIDQVQLPDGSQYHIIDDTSGYATTTYVQDQISTINKNTIGLGNVDNTADINKPVSLPQQTALDGKVDDDIVAYVENDTTATKRHEVGDQFILNGVLYTATAIIAVNDTIVIGTNCDSAESVATQITENANAIVSLRSDITSINQTGTTATQAISSGTYFYLNEVLVKAKTDIANGATFTLNTNYEVVSVGGLNDVTKKWARLSLDTRGSISHSVTINEDDTDIYIEVSYIESSLSICMPIILPRNALASSSQIYALPCLYYDANNISSGAVNVSLSGNTLNYEIRWLMVDGNSKKNSAYIIAMTK